MSEHDDHHDTAQPNRGITVTVDIDQLLFHGPNDEPRSTADIVLDGAIDVVARRVLGYGGEGAPLDTARREAAERVRAIRDDEIREAVRPIITEAIEQVTQRTNSFGEPIGEPVSLRTMIVAVGKEELSKPHRVSGRESTVLSEVIKAEVGKALHKELADAVADAKALVIEAVKNDAAEAIGKAISTGLTKQRR